MRALRGDGSVIELDEKDILYFTTYKNIITVHTQHDEFVLPTSLDQLQKAYEGIGFAKVDRSFIANMNHAIGFEAERRSLILGNDAGKEPKYVPVSEPNLPKVIKRLKNKED